ncbi:MAG: carbohydrate ABC transporter permease [Oscillospiraceae bacterium]|nr:carbohydrate ABC transporter permease [Oscillospiraceae bacterium]
MAKYKGITVNPAKFHRSQIKFYIILLPMIVLALLPLIYIISTAFKPIEELFIYPPAFFVKNPTMANFRKLFGAAENTAFPMSLYLFNSIIVTVAVVFLGCLISLMAAYALSKRKFKGRKTIFKANQLALMFVGSMLGIPRYLVINALGLTDTFWVNVIPLLIMPTGVFLIKQFIDDVPDSLIEAARIDGAGEFRILTRVVFPVIKPAMATVAILFFQSAWNSVEASNMYINTEGYKTFAYYMNVLSSAGNGVAGRGMAAAASLIVVVPNIVLFVIMQSRVMDTMARSGIK